jgi:2-oxoglutarate ferredoxin oxidoreductase subunit alpha
MRGGPGLGNIQPTQADYNQLTKSAGHGDFHSIVLAPSSVQEAIDFTVLAFDLAEKYRTIAIVAGDGMIGQMMEPAELPAMKEPPATRPNWALTGAAGRDKNIITSLSLNADGLEAINHRLQEKINRIRAEEVRYEEWLTDDIDILVVAFGTTGRIAKTAIREAREDGVRVGLLRPITLFPFPFAPLRELSKRVKTILVVEMSAGQMVEDVRLGIQGKVPIHFYGRTGGAVPLPDEILDQIMALSARLDAGAEVDKDASGELREFAGARLSM